MNFYLDPGADSRPNAEIITSLTKKMTDSHPNVEEFESLSIKRQRLLSGSTRK